VTELTAILSSLKYLPSLQTFHSLALEGSAGANAALCTFQYIPSRQVHGAFVQHSAAADGSCASRKFGKQIQKRQLEVPEYAASFVNYKALKKVR